MERRSGRLEGEGGEKVLGERRKGSLGERGRRKGRRGKCSWGGMKLWWRVGGGSEERGYGVLPRDGVCVISHTAPRISHSCRDLRKFHLLFILVVSRHTFFPELYKLFSTKERLFYAKKKRSCTTFASFPCRATLCSRAREERPHVGILHLSGKQAKPEMLCINYLLKRTWNFARKKASDLHNQNNKVSKVFLGMVKFFRPANRTVPETFVAPRSAHLHMMCKTELTSADKIPPEDPKGPTVNDAVGQQCYLWVHYENKWTTPMNGKRESPLLIKEGKK